MTHWLYNKAGRWDCYAIDGNDPPRLRGYVIGKFHESGTPEFCGHLVGLKTINGDAVAEFTQPFGTLFEAMRAVDGEVA